MLIFYIGFGLFTLGYLIARPFILIITGTQKNQPARVKRGKKALLRNTIGLAVIGAVGLIIYYLVNGKG
ncbi:MAG: hypothetical protein M0D57_10065 [Sphingobacteriales bacterium JAD_PAG50586_3]|nr:MAG: hypothetical protein M0D57_10065 [Sphingobacteriales bacterium JAD_PAG50586_3]